MDPIIYCGQEVSIEHLAPSQLRCACGALGRDLLISVDYKNHCYTEAFDAKRHSKEQIILYDAPERPRVFCPIRHGHSACLPAAIANLPLRKVHQTSQRRNYVYIIPLEVAGQVYEIYFMLQRASANDPVDLRLTVESAYPVDVRPILPKRPNSIRFSVLAYKVLKNEPVRFAPR